MLSETCPSFYLSVWKVFKVLVHMLERMARYTVKEHCQVVEKSLVQELQRLWNIWNDKQNSGEQESLKSQIGFLLRLTNVWVSWKSGCLVSDPVQLFNVSTYKNFYAESIQCMFLHVLYKPTCISSSEFSPQMLSPCPTVANCLPTLLIRTGYTVFTVVGIP